MSDAIPPPAYRTAIELAINATVRALRHADPEFVAAEVDTAVRLLQRAKRLAVETADTVRPGVARRYTTDEMACIADCCGD